MGVLHKIYDRDGKLVSTSGIALYLEPGESSDCMVRPTVETPHLWTDEDPYLYTLDSWRRPAGRLQLRSGIRPGQGKHNELFHVKVRDVVYGCIE